MKDHFGETIEIGGTVIFYRNERITSGVVVAVQGQEVRVKVTETVNVYADNVNVLEEK